MSCVFAVFFRYTEISLIYVSTSIQAPDSSTDRYKEPFEPVEHPVQGLLLVAHGSRVQSSNKEIARLRARLATRLRNGDATETGHSPDRHHNQSSINLIEATIDTGNNAPTHSNGGHVDTAIVDTAIVDTAIVEYAFLELSEPSIPQGIDACAAKGVTELFVLPYFLAAGRHVREDIPAAVEDGRLRHPDMTISILSHVGQSESMLDLIIAMTNEPRSPAV